MLALFEKFRLRYGDLWTSRIGTTREEIEAMAAEWARCLSSLNGDDLKRGLDTWCDQYPPNVMQFRKACQPPEPTPEAHRRYVGLSILGPGRDEGLRRVAELREALKQ